ncbi:DUF5919 domain-containing protein [Nocardia rosealba]|uniref:DUF5919 domain-containing protein n=1 Tax=Nocardia rosealba TaxID=2878563 RepID=UPI001CDA1FDC|nr:DUF5919 domain-containing protein [Nocardia rosealba]MCA2207390.1 DUF5919 domain-containing protein [Nocardia rosealba]
MAHLRYDQRKPPQDDEGYSVGTVLKALLQQRHIQTVSAFNREYDAAASKIDSSAIGAGPKKAQFYRWLSGNISTLPYPHHCRVLQEMFPGWSIEELFSGYTEGTDLSPHKMTAAPPSSSSTGQISDIESVFTRRADFLKAIPPQELFREARTIDLAGLSLNILCQQCSDSEVRRMMRDGTTIRCLLLDPDGSNITEREHEEGHASGALVHLTRLNIHMLQRVRSSRTTETGGRIEIRVYDAPVRFNLCIIDSEICVMQPYLPFARGLESPTFVSKRRAVEGTFQTFATVFEEMWRKGTEPEIEYNQGVTA